MIHWKRLWCWEGLGAGGEGDDRGRDGWMASLTQWTWVWVNSGSWWWTGRPGVLRFMESQIVGHDWATDLIWSDLIISVDSIYWITIILLFRDCLFKSNFCHLSVIRDLSNQLNIIFWGYQVTFESSFLIKIYLLILTKRKENSYVYSIKS